MWKAKFWINIQVFWYQLSNGVTRNYLCLFTTLEIKIVPYLNIFQAKIVQCEYGQNMPKLITEQYPACF